MSRFLVAAAVNMMTVVCTAHVALADDGYELVAAPPPALKSGHKATLSLSVAPRAGHRLLPDGPLLVRLTGDGLKLPRLSFERDDAVDPRADVPRFELPIVAGARGPAHLTAACTFYLCQGARCRPVETSTTWTLTIE
jgi:hypothetical protein